MLKCLCRCSTFFLVLAHTHTELKVEPIIISAANYGFGNYFEVFYKNIAKPKHESGRNVLLSKCVQVHNNDMMEGIVTHSQFSVINIIKLLFEQLTSA